MIGKRMITAAMNLLSPSRRVHLGEIEQPTPPPITTSSSKKAAKREVQILTNHGTKSVVAD
jgi:hypothetical protein